MGTNALVAQEVTLALGQVLLSPLGDEQRVETSEITAVVSFGGTEELQAYSIELTDRATGARSRTDFEQDPGEPKLSAYNDAYYCGEHVFFITMRYAPPRFADGRQYRLETHAFHRASLRYLGTAFVAFEDIALLEFGVDLGFDYTQPQPYHVACSVENGAFELGFFANDETSDQSHSVTPD